MPVPRRPAKMVETRSQASREGARLRQISPRVVKRARLEALVLVPLFVAVVVLYDHRVGLFGRETRAYRDARGALHPAHKYLEPALETPITVVAVIVLVILGWAVRGDRARHRAQPRPAAVPAAGPRDRGHGGLLDPSADDHPRAAGRLPRGGDPGARALPG